MTSKVETYRNNYLEYQTFEKSHKIAATSVVILGIALAGIGFYLSGSLPLDLSVRIIGSSIGGVAFTTVALSALVASYVLRGSEMRENVSNSELYEALCEPTSNHSKHSQLLALLNKKTRNQFIHYIDKRFFEGKLDILQLKAGVDMAVRYILDCDRPKLSETFENAFRPYGGALILSDEI